MDSKRSQRNESDYLQAQEMGGKLPLLLVIVTGKGPQKAAYLQRMQQMDLRHVAFRCLWLASEDYPVLLGSSDLGLSLHYSSSGLDLPMKAGFLQTLSSDRTAQLQIIIKADCS